MEEQIKQLMGESYHEGITTEEIQEFFKNSVLGTGEYVNKSMADAEKTKLQNQLTKAQQDLQNKLTDEEKIALAQTQKDEEIKQLKEMLAKNTLSANSDKAYGLMAEARLNADIKEGDTEFADFLTNIVSDDTEKTQKVSSYVNKIVKAAYEKGKADMTKQKMAGMGNFNKNENNNEGGNQEGLGARLAKSNVQTNSKNPYFKI